MTTEHAAMTDLASQLLDKLDRLAVQQALIDSGYGTYLDLPIADVRFVERLGDECVYVASFAHGADRWERRVYVRYDAESGKYLARMDGLLARLRAWILGGGK